MRILKTVFGLGSASCPLLRERLLQRNKTLFVCKSSWALNKMSGEHEGVTLSRVVAALEGFADARLAETWDNVGLLVEPAGGVQVRTVLLTNDLTEPVLREALTTRANLIVSYHPPIFAALKRVTTSTWKERVVGTCLEHKIAVYSPHTAWDAVQGGVTDWLTDAFSGDFDETDRASLIPSKSSAEPLNEVTVVGPELTLTSVISRMQQEGRNTLLKSTPINGGRMSVTVVCYKKDIEPFLLLPDTEIFIRKAEQKVDTKVGMGRVIKVNNLSLEECVQRIKKHTGLAHVRLATAVSATTDSKVGKIALVPGSGGSLLRGVKADLYVTGEMLHHDILEATHNGASVILTNHSDSERGFLKFIKEKLELSFQSSVEVIVSTSDRDPVVTV